jgi:hypothetical protein
MAVYTVTHPGFPAIGAIEKFRLNAEKEIDKGDAALSAAIQKMPQYRAKEIKHSGRASLKMRKKQAHPELISPEKRDSIAHFNTYINKSEWKAGSEHIKNEIEKKMREFMLAAMTQARDTTRSEVKGMQRAFKSSHKSSESAGGDLYHTIGDSLEFEETHPKDSTVGRNQFISFIGASSDGGKLGFPSMGVMGSRQGAGEKSLIELTEVGKGPFNLDIKQHIYLYNIRRNPAKRMKGG